MSRILFIITQSEMGGAQRYLLEFVKYLKDKKCEVTVVAGEGDGEIFKRLESIISGSDPDIIEARPRQIKIPSLVRGLNPFKDVSALFSILKIMKKERPDVLFLQSTKAGFLGALAAKLYKIRYTKYDIRVVYRIGGWSFRDPRPAWMNRILLWMEKTSAPLKDKIIVNSEFDRQLAVDKKIAPVEKIERIYNGVNPSDLNFVPKEKSRSFLESRIQNLESSNNIVIGTIANLYATKGIEHLIEAANILNQKFKIQDSRFKIQFVVIGEGKERPKLESLIKKYNLKNFFLIGRAKNASQYLKAFDIFVLPSVKEGFPWVLLEAMAAEVPIVATKVGAVPEIIEDGKNGLLAPPKNANALAQKIFQLTNVQNAHDREYYVKNAREKLKQFSLEKMLEESEKVING